MQTIRVVTHEMLVLAMLLRYLLPFLSRWATFGATLGFSARNQSGLFSGGFKACLQAIRLVMLEMLLLNSMFAPRGSIKAILLVMLAMLLLYRTFVFQGSVLLAIQLVTMLLLYRIDLEQRWRLVF